MAVCNWCGEEMTRGSACSVAELHRGGVGIPLIRSGDERAEMGTFSCGCRFDEDEQDLDHLELDSNRSRGGRRCRRSRGGHALFRRAG